MIISDNPCTINGYDYFRMVKPLIGTTSHDTIQMSILNLLQ